ncbi:hypothetical protein RFI_24111 [Reticulomyxa filosa]|uniref:UBA domain-containing protein n=1 Tax=Reticulomyxa filosa TaxID=46433 RepID=X6MGW7_RETFI|nr:hypothetical protein RFI_24111 [Reticulomyxa filosa]|eukprot:ETO13263.1 hypothetical protein RFI_24111 [Reticulomyxa filosa]
MAKDENSTKSSKKDILKIEELEEEEQTQAALKLANMGFPWEDCVKAVKTCGTDIERAANYLGEFTLPESQLQHSPKLQTSHLPTVPDKGTGTNTKNSTNNPTNKDNDKNTK